MSNVKTTVKPKLSIVIASQNAQTSVAECLQAIENQRGGHELEVVVVDTSTDETADIIACDFPHIKLVRAAKNQFIPQLWGIGIGESTGDYVALTTTHFVPANNWIAEILKIHDSQKYAGVGGAIENDNRAGIVSWAIYFCRYSRYMLPFAQGETDDFAADNASYKRSSLERVKQTIADGFWEVFVHQAMQKEKMPLALSPEIIVYHRDSFTFSGFVRQRFLHGRQFGNTRAANISGAKLIALILLSPLIPFIYLYRISRRVFGRKRNVGKYLLSLPVLFLFLISWSIGEFCGYLAGTEKSCENIR